MTTTTGVLVVTRESARQWVGPHPAAAVLLRAMREVRNLDTITVANCSGGDLPYSLDAEVVPVVVKTTKPADPADVVAAAAALAPAGVVVLCHAATPLVSAAAIERCAAAIGGGVVSAQTVVESRGFVHLSSGWAELDVPVVVRGVLAVSQKARQECATVLKPSQLRFVPVSRKEALSLAEPDDLEVIQALEYAGRI